MNCGECDVSWPCYTDKSKCIRDPQAVYDTTVRHLASMSGPSLDKRKESCAYRGEGGTRCAVGYWMPDETYNKKFEGNPIKDGIRSKEIQQALPPPLRTSKLINLLSDLQCIHDHCYHPNRTWELPFLIHRLKDLARRRKLRVTVVNEAFKNL